MFDQTHIAIYINGMYPRLCMYEKNLILKILSSDYVLKR